MTGAERRSRPTDPATYREGRIGVIDIGSNSVRLVVFDQLTRAPVPLFNEKLFAALGKTVGETGHLNPEGVAQTFEMLTRFSRLLEAMNVASCHVVATAAVRDAVDGPDFLAEVRRRAGLSVTIISGEEEGRLSAEGVLSGIPDADGVMGDMGGGSVELVRLHKGVVGPRVTMPFGPFRLMSIGGGRGNLIPLIDSRLEALPWLGDCAGATFYAVGGVWRAFAKVHMEQVSHPLHIIHHYAIEADEAVDFAQLISKQSRISLENSGISRRRIEALPYAAMFMERLLKRAKPRRLVFSAYGLREGILYDMLSPEERALDPLVVACNDVAHRIGRFGPPDPLIRWLEPLIAPQPKLRRLALAACLLSDIAWLEHPDYRAQQAYLRALQMPLGGVDHADRAFLAIALLLRYGGRADDPQAAVARQLLDEPLRREASAIGLALRLGHTLSGGALSILESTRLWREGGKIVLSIAPEAADLKVEVVERRLDAFAKSLGVTGEIRLASTRKADRLRPVDR